MGCMVAKKYVEKQYEFHICKNNGLRYDGSLGAVLGIIFAYFMCLWTPRLGLKAKTYPTLGQLFYNFVENSWGNFGGILGAKAGPKCN